MNRVDWSVSIRNAADGAVLHEESPNAVLRTASIGKVLLLFRVAELVDRAELDLSEPITRAAGDAVADSGVWQHLRTDTLTIADLCELIGMASDNLATNVLLAKVGLAGVAETAARLGLSVTALHDRVRDVRRPGDPATLSTGSAAELASLMCLVHRDAPTDPVAAQVQGWLRKGLDLSQVASGWGLDPLAHEQVDLGLSVINKTGTDSGVRAEIGVLSGPALAVAYAVIANWDGSAASRRVVLARQRRLGRRIARAARGERTAGDGRLDW